MNKDKKKIVSTYLPDNIEELQNNLNAFVYLVAKNIAKRFNYSKFCIFVGSLKLKEELGVRCEVTLQPLVKHSETMLC